MHSAMAGTRERKTSIGHGVVRRVGTAFYQLRAPMLLYFRLFSLPIFPFRFVSNNFRLDFRVLLAYRRDALADSRDEVEEEVGR